MILVRSQNARLSGREIRVAEELVSLPAATHDCSALFALSGQAVFGEFSLAAGQAALLPSQLARAAFGDGVVIAIDGFPDVEKPRLAKRTRLGEFDRYGASVERLHWTDRPEDEPGWSVYSVGIAPRSGRCELHIHDRVNNIVLIEGAPERPTAELVAAHAGHVWSWTLYGSSCAIVPPGVEHAVVGTSSNVLRMFVVNDAPSHYEDLTRADFRRTRGVPWAGMTRGLISGSGRCHELRIGP